jgi:hypothetical protein
MKPFGSDFLEDIATANEVFGSQGTTITSTYTTSYQGSQVDSGTENPPQSD